VKPTGQAQRSLPATAARDESGMENFRTDRYRFLYYDTIPFLEKYKNCHLQLIL